MSDFDKEAEREKLREKYERDKADREATQRMSDLLLKGATMTNTHCGVCGDPLFRQDGVTFCPTCHGSPEAVEGTDLEVDADDDGDDAEGASEAVDRTEPAESDDEPSTASEATGDSGGTQIDVSSPSASRPSEAGQSADASADARETDALDSTANAGASDASTPTSTSSSSSSSASSPSRRTRPAPSGDLEDAHASLTRALEYFSQEAATTDDPRYAKECLEAAREAAETLSALR